VDFYQFTMPSAHEKGSALEIAVRAIEQAILATAPAYNEKTFRIVQRKIISVSGLRTTSSYSPRKSGPAQAQKGFFAAKSFTSDAEAQARLDPRVGLLPVTDFPLEACRWLAGCVV
jgi:hypothetical protein